MTDHIETLKAYNAWHRGTGKFELLPPSPATVCLAIDALIAEVEKLRINEKASLEVIKKWRVERMEMVAEIERLRSMLKKARDGLSAGLWDYGPGQNEHDQCDELIGCLDAELTRHGPSAQAEVCGRVKK